MLCQWPSQIYHFWSSKSDTLRDAPQRERPVRKKHFAAITDPKEVGPLLRMLDGYGGSLQVRCALRLAPLVFVRPGELLKARWADIDLEGAEWQLHGDEDRNAARWCRWRVRRSRFSARFIL